MGAVTATVMKQHDPGLTDPQLRQLIALGGEGEQKLAYIVRSSQSKILSYESTHFTLTGGKFI